MLVQVVRDQNTAGMTGAGTNLSDQGFNVRLDVWILY
jgi:hypothetical protein